MRHLHGARGDGRPPLKEHCFNHEAYLQALQRAATCHVQAGCPLPADAAALYQAAWKSKMPT
jgi:hypothetical protein